MRDGIQNDLQMGSRPVNACIAALLAGLFGLYTAAAVGQEQESGPKVLILRGNQRLELELKPGGKTTARLPNAASSGGDAAVQHPHSAPTNADRLQPERASKGAPESQESNADEPLIRWSFPTFPATEMPQENRSAWPPGGRDEGSLSGLHPDLFTPANPLRQASRERSPPATEARSGEADPVPAAVSAAASPGSDLPGDARSGGSASTVVAPADPVSLRHDAWSDPSVVRIVAASVAISFALTVLALGWVVLTVRQQIGEKRDATIRVELSQPAAANFVLPSPAAPPTEVPGEPDPQARRDARVVDFADVSLATPTGPTFEECRQEEERCRKELEQAILQQIFQDNVALQLGGDHPAPAPAIAC
ncbi:MAG TPA: hypothetical protein PLF81_08970 [Candidatus Anammoximicrobium sp.]|nr:hypothetical protein [Candidatus Anammoximicrobium sp.]